MDVSPQLHFIWPKRMRIYEDNVRMIPEVNRASRVLAWATGEEYFVEHRANSSCLVAEEDEMVAVGSAKTPSTTSNTEFWMEHNDEHKFFLSEAFVKKPASSDTSSECLIDTESEKVNLQLEFLADFYAVFEHQALLKRVFYE